MWLDAVALAILGLFVGVGAMRGALASGLGLLTLGVAYGLAVFSAPRYAEVVAEAVGAPPWLGMPLAGTAGFLVGFVAMGIVSAVLRRLERRGRYGARGARDRLLGGLLGGARGLLIVLLLSYLALWAEALRTSGTLEALPELGDSKAAAVTGSVVEAGVEAALGDSGSAGRLVARMASHPGTAIPEFQEVMEHPAIAELKGDRLFWSYVEYGNVEAALNRGSFLQISYDSELRDHLGGLGFIDADAVEDPERFRDQARDVLAEVGPRLRDIKEDPAMRELMADPAVLERVQSGDTLALLSDVRFREVVSRALDGVEP